MGRGVKHFLEEGSKLVNETIDDPYRNEGHAALVKPGKQNAKAPRPSRPAISSSSAEREKQTVEDAIGSSVRTEGRGFASLGVYHRRMSSPADQEAADRMQREVMGVSREELELLFRRAETARLRAQGTVAACLAAQQRRAANRSRTQTAPMPSLAWSEPTKEDVDWLWANVDEIRNGGG
jgi:hypothetical protein